MDAQLSTRNKGEYLGFPMVISTLGQFPKFAEEGVLSSKRFFVLDWTVVAGIKTDASSRGTLGTPPGST